MVGVRGQLKMVPIEEQIRLKIALALWSHNEYKACMFMYSMRRTWLGTSCFALPKNDLPRMVGDVEGGGVGGHVGRWGG